MLGGRAGFRIGCARVRRSQSSYDDRRALKLRSTGKAYRVRRRWLFAVDLDKFAEDLVNELAGYIKKGAILVPISAIADVCW